MRVTPGAAASALDGDPGAPAPAPRPVPPGTLGFTLLRKARPGPSPPPSSVTHMHSIHPPSGTAQHNMHGHGVHASAARVLAAVAQARFMNEVHASTTSECDLPSTARALKMQADVDGTEGVGKSLRNGGRWLLQHATDTLPRHSRWSGSHNTARHLPLGAAAALARPSASSGNNRMEGRRCFHASRFSSGGRLRAAVGLRPETREGNHMPVVRARQHGDTTEWLPSLSG